MTAQKLTAFRLPEDLREALAEIKRRDGIPVSEQVRRALAAWVQARKVTAASAIGNRKAAATRRRPRAGERD